MCDGVDDIAFTGTNGRNFLQKWRHPLYYYYNYHFYYYNNHYHDDYYSILICLVALNVTKNYIFHYYDCYYHYYDFITSTIHQINNIFITIMKILLLITMITCIMMNLMLL
jgi:hypothetical protein